MKFTPKQRLVRNLRLFVWLLALLPVLGMPLANYGATATIFNARWNNEVDIDGDGYKRSAVLNWDPDVAGGGALTVYEKIYWKTASGSTWNLMLTLADHPIYGVSSVDQQSVEITVGSHDLYDWKIEIYRSGQEVPDYTRDPSNDPDLDNYAMETAAEDTLNPGLLQFSAAAYNVGENAGTVRIYVSRVGGFNGIASVTYKTANGAALAGSDYSASSGTLDWANGDAAEKYFDVTILNDFIYDPSESFTVSLSEATGASLGTPATTTIFILDDDPRLAVSPADGLSSSGNAGGPFSPESQAYDVSNTGVGTLNWSANADANWVTVSPASGQNSGTVTVSINANANSLGTGIHNATVTFGGNGGSTTRAVQLTVLALPQLSVNPSTGFTASCTQGGPVNPSIQEYNVSNAGGGTLNWTASADANWVTVSPFSGQNAGTVTVSINANSSSLGVGTHNATVTFSGNGASTTRSVQLTVNAPPQISVYPSTGFNSSGARGGPFSPASQEYNVVNTGEGTLNWTVNADASWVTVSPFSGQNAGTVTVSINANANLLGAGTYHGTVTFSSNGGSTTRAVQLTISPVSNDNFTNRIVLSGVLVATTGQNTNATKEPEEPNHAGATGGKSVWWSWTAPAVGTVTISTAGSSFDTVLGVYTGSSVANLQTIASNDDANDNTNTSQVVFPVASGTEYEIAVDGYGADSGTIALSLNLEVLPERPSLSINMASNAVVLSWGTNWPGYVLESAKSLKTGGTWDQTTTEPVVVGPSNVVTNAITRPALFYRLRKE